MAAENLQHDYRFEHLGAEWTSRYLWRPVAEAIGAHLPPGGRVFELGCGNGAAAAMLGEMGYAVTGVDPSESGLAIARQHATKATLAAGSAYDDLAATYGQFPVVISLEVVEHCFWPRKFAATVYDLLEPGGLAIISTPFHGYFKNLLLAVFDRFDAHWAPLWDGGHIKFWSERTLRDLLVQAGFEPVTFVRAGRFAPIAKSMIALARKPPRQAR